MAPRKNTKVVKQNNKARINNRYTAITGCCLIIALLIAYKLFAATVIDADAWNKRAIAELSKIDTVPPERGNILASNGSILACNLTVYDIKLDLRHNKVRALTTIPREAIDSLADSLDVYYPRVDNLHASPERYAEWSWRTRLHAEFDKAPDKRPRALRLARARTVDDFHRIASFPFLNRFDGSGFRNPLYAVDYHKRIYPFGRMASRSIGRVNEDASGAIHGYSGLEKDLDSLLYGQVGLARKVALTTGISNWMSVAAKRGYDVLTTIDIDIQEMLEEQLRQICDSSHAEWGTAIVMEVATGEIKAISNVERLEDGSYGEALNRAVLPFEPGSVMKPISLMIAFEDGLVHSVNDMIDCSPFQRTSDPHAPGVKSMKQVIEMSSNTGIARVIFRGYAQDPAKFHDRLASIGFFDPIRSGIAGECIPQVRRLTASNSKGQPITMTARHLDLARQAYGYNTEIPPLYTLAIYNAIANGGRYVRPHLVRGLRDENGVDSIIPIDYIRDRICSEETARKVRECIHEVVWGSHGTARMVQDDRVKVVGKTGTAFPVGKGGYDKSRRRYAFAGFFPYERPRYSCISLILGPGGTSANRTSGQVVKNMAIKMYARGMLGHQSNYRDKRAADKPLVASSAKTDAHAVAAALHTSGVSVRAQKPATHGAGRVPSVVGTDLPTAVATLERAGLNVRVQGSGVVVAQSIAPGTIYRHGQRIVLTLKS